MCYFITLWFDFMTSDNVFCNMSNKMMNGSTTEKKKNSQAIKGGSVDEAPTLDEKSGGRRFKSHSDHLAGVVSR